MHRSVSQYSTYVQCGERYRLERVAGAPQTPAAWLVQGTAVHAAVEAYELSYRALTADEAVAIFRAKYEEGIRELLEVEPVPDRWLTGNANVKGSLDIARRQDTGEQQVRDYVAAMPSSPMPIYEPMPDYLAIELAFELDLDGLRVKGFIDQVLAAPDGSPYVRDLKTGTKLPDSAMQLGVYALAWESMFGELPRYGDFWMFKNNGPTKPYNLSMYTRERVTRWFKDMDRSESAGIYLPNVGSDCRVCSVYQWCEAAGSPRTDYQPGGNQVG